MLRSEAMGSVTQDPATGVGTLDLGGTQHVIEIDTLVNALADLYRTTGAAPYRRIYQQARIGLSFVVGSPPIHLVVWDHFIEHDGEVINIADGAGLDANTFFWEVEPGGSMRCGIYWP
jgi:hypothetical protein